MTRFVQRSEKCRVEEIRIISSRDPTIVRPGFGAEGMVGDIQSTAIEVKSDLCRGLKHKLLLRLDRKVSPQDVCGWMNAAGGNFSYQRDEVRLLMRQVPRRLRSSCRRVRIRPTGHRNGIRRSQEHRLELF